MKYFLLFLAMLTIVSVSSAQYTPQIINELNNSPTLRQLLWNALQGNYASGQDAFTTTAIKDTITIPGLTSTSLVVATAWSSTAADTTLSGDILRARYLSANTAVVARKSGGTSGLKYVWTVTRW